MAILTVRYGTKSPGVRRAAIVGNCMMSVKEEATSKQSQGLFWERAACFAVRVSLRLRVFVVFVLQL
jgi:hypothetical protein